MKFKIKKCSVCGDMIVCPACGNNCCNGGHGKTVDGKGCEVCKLAYQYQDAFFYIERLEDAIDLVLEEMDSVGFKGYKVGNETLEEYLESCLQTNPLELVVKEGKK